MNVGIVSTMVKDGTITITVTRDIEVKEGWGVYFIPVWTGEEDERIVDVDAGIVRIAPDTITLRGGVLCVKAEDGDIYFPVENFRELKDLWEDDTHDLRDRWFATEQEAQEHLEYSLNRWRHPQPWESFVKVA